MLIDKCPGCQKRMSWARPGINKCRCGVDWREGELTPVDPNELKLSKLISELCGFAYDKSSLSSQKEDAYSTLDLNDLIQVLSLMANYYLLLTKGHRLKNTTENGLCHSAYSFVAPIFEDWPKNYFNFLEWVRMREGYQGITALHKEVGKQCGKASLFFVTASLENFAEKAWDSLEDSGEFYLPIQTQFINRREASLKLGVAEVWLDVLIAQGKVEAYREDGFETLIYLPSIELLLSKISDLATHWSAAEFLGVHASDIMYLIRNGCLRALSGPEIDGFSQWALETIEVTSLMRKIERKIINGKLPRFSKVTSGVSVLKYLKQYGLSAGKFILDMLNDEIVPVGEVKGEGIPKFLFLKKQVISYRRNLKPEDLPIDVFNYREKFLEKLKKEKAFQERRSIEEREKIFRLVKGIMQLLDKEWERNDMVYTNKGIEFFSVRDLADKAKKLLGTKELS
jgi:hypothetical protein